MKLRKTIKKLLAYIFFIIILVSFSLIFVGYYITNNYKALLKKFDITVEEKNCEVSLSKISCEYINLYSKNFKVNISNLNTDIFWKNLFTEKKLASISIETLNLKVKDLKKRQSKNSNLKNFFNYLYTFFKKTEIYVKKSNVSIGDLTLKNIEFKSKESFFYILKPTIVLYKDFKGKIRSFNGEIQEGKILINSLQGQAFKSDFLLKGFYSLEGIGKFDGFVKGNFIKFLGNNFNDFNISFKLLTNNKNFTFKIDGNINKVEGDKLGIVDKIKFNLDGNFKEKLHSNIDFSFYSGYILDNFFVKNFHLSGNISSEEFFRNLKGNFNARTSKLESERFLFSNLVSNFTLEKNKLTKIKGNLSANPNINFSFLATFKNLKDFSVDINNINTTFESLKLSLKKKIKILDKLSGKILGNILYTSKENLNFDIGLKDLNLFGAIFENGNLSLSLNLKDLSFLSKIVLKNKNSFLKVNLNGKSKALVNGYINYRNLDISNLFWVKLAKLKTIISGEGKIYGSLQEPKVRLNGIAKDFIYNDIKIKNLDYTFFYENKKILIKANKQDNLEGDVNIHFNPFKLKIAINARKLKGDIFQKFLLKLNNKVFGYIKPQEVNGNLNIFVNKSDFKVKLDFNNSNVLLLPLDSTFTTNLTGEISKNKFYLKGNFGKENLFFKGINISHIQGSFSFKNKKLNLKVLFRNSTNIKNLFAILNLNLDIKYKKLNTSLALSGEKNGYIFAISSKFKGKFEKIKGYINYALLNKNSYVISKDLLNLEGKIDEGIYAKIFKNSLNLSFSPKLVAILDSPQLEVFFEENEKSIYFFSPKIDIYKSKLKVLSLKSLLLKLDKEKVVIYQFFHSGFFNGKVDNLVYTFADNKLKVFANGKLNKQLISQILGFLSVNGYLNYVLYYEGNIKDFISKAKIKLSSKNLSIKSNYIVGILQVKDLLAYMENSVFNVWLKAEDNLALLSKGSVELFGTHYFKKKKTYTYVEINTLPVKYLSLFKGTTNAKIGIKLDKEGGKISGSILIGGSLKLNTDLIRGKTKRNFASQENLEKIKLNISLSSYLPIYIYGDWGEAYAEIKGKITGSLANPIFNGEITIIYGKISYMKNFFNIDFANISISNNIPFLSARLSTIVANTHIFVDIVGNPPDDLTLSFSSIPPRTQEEIMAILLLKNTPNTLENIPMFTALGKLIRNLLPLEKFLYSGNINSTFFNTGFDISIAPRYSPTEGIVATIYAKRDITRRFFIALSKPISQNASQTLVGWYEGGFRITENTSLFYRFYEDSTNEFGIIFNLQFDF